MADSNRNTDDLTLFPADAQARICSMAMALDGAAALANEMGDSRILGILELVQRDLSRMNDQVEAIAEDALDWIEAEPELIA